MRSPTSDDDDDDSYGSEAQVETEETKMGNELSHKYHGPEWDGKKESYTEWRWEATTRGRHGGMHEPPRCESARCKDCTEHGGVSTRE